MNNYLNIAHNLVLINDIPALRTTPIAGLLVQENGVNALHLAGGTENVEVIMLIAQRFIENGIPINIPDAHGNTILHHIGCFLEDDAATIHTLLGMFINIYGANITIQNNAGDTILHNAIYHSNSTIAVYLIHTQILAAIDTGLHPRIPHLLIRNNNGYNPLHAAVEMLQDLQGNDDRMAIRNIIIRNRLKK